MLSVSFHEIDFIGFLPFFYKYAQTFRVNIEHFIAYANKTELWLMQSKAKYYAKRMYRLRSLWGLVGTKWNVGRSCVACTNWTYSTLEFVFHFFTRKNYEKHKTKGKDKENACFMFMLSSEACSTLYRARNLLKL